MEANCGFCSNKFTLSRPSEKKAKNYCSKECYFNYLRSIKYISSKCVACGIEFMALRSQVKRGLGKCCSLKCNGRISCTGKRKPAIKNKCIICGNEYKARAELLKKGKGLFCSNICYGKWSSENNRGKKHHFYIEREVRRCVLCEDEFYCIPSSKQKLCSRLCTSQYASSHNAYFHNKLEKKLAKLLDFVGVRYEAQKKIDKIAFPDFFIKPNICVFADGDYWHNYPNGTAKDFMQNKLLESNGFKVIRFWERDINNNVDMVKNKIINEIGAGEFIKMDRI